MARDLLGGSGGCRGDVRRCGAVCLIALCALSLRAATCLAAEVEIVSATVGYDGYYQLGRWSPIHVEVNPGSLTDWQVEVVVPDPDGHPTRRALQAEEDPDDEARGVRMSGLFRMGRLNQPIQVELVSESEVVDTYSIAAEDINANRPLTTRSSLWLLVGKTEIFQAVPNWLEQRAADGEGALSRQVVVVHRDDASLIPASVDDLDGVDLVVLGDNYELTAMQSTALRQWVERGGRLIVPIGSRLDAYQTSPIAEWSPLQMGETRYFTSLGPLTALVSSTTGINLFFRIEGVNLLPDNGQVLAEGSEGPLALRVAHGLGTITASAIDLDLDVILEWEPAPELALALADMAELATLEDAAADSGGAIGSGHVELQTQVATVLDQYGTEPITSFSVLGLLLAYLVAIGAIDYLLVHRLLRRPQLTWVTLPIWLMAGVFLTSAYGRSHSSSMDAARRVELIDVVADVDQVRVHDWLAMYSSSPKRQDIHEVVDSSWTGQTEVPLTWAGFPESGFRGMFRQVGLSFGDPDYSYDHETLGLVRFPRLPNASRVLEGDSWLSSDSIVESTLRDDGRGQLAGNFTHHLPAPITDWFIAYRNTAYYPTSDISIEPDREFTTIGFPHPVIRSYLTGAGAQQTTSDPDRTDARMTRRAYDRSAKADLDDIVRMISFHDAAGGEGYTSSQNVYLQRLELSRLLDLRRAVVFGKLDDGVVSLELDGQPTGVDTATYIRIVLPVEAP